jgi:hypothetical protein
MDEYFQTDQKLLQRDLNSPRVLAGIRRGKWRIVRCDFPDLIVQVNVSVALGPDVAFMFHCLCDDYPGIAPYVEIWDDVARQRPSGLSIVSPGVQDAFKDWGKFPSGGIYRAWQRAAADHGNWAMLRPDEAWNRNRTIVFVLERLYELVFEEAVCLGLSKAA